MHSNLKWASDTQEGTRPHTFCRSEERVAVNSYYYALSQSGLALQLLPVFWSKWALLAH